MSGPKSVSYSVSGEAAAIVAERERRRIRREQLRARGAALSRELARCAERWREAGRRYGEGFPAWPHEDAPPESLDSSRPDTLDAVVGAVADRLAQARRELARQSTLFRMRTSLQAASQLHASDSRAAEGAGDGQTPRQGGDGPGPPSTSRACWQLAAEASNEERTAVEKRPRRRPRRGGGGRKPCSSTAFDVQRANAAAEAAGGEVEQAARWRGGWPGSRAGRPRADRDFAGSSRAGPRLPRRRTWSKGWSTSRPGRSRRRIATLR